MRMAPENSTGGFKMFFEKEVYEAPMIEFVEFEFEDSIATSAMTGAGFTEWIFD